VRDLSADIRRQRADIQGDELVPIHAGQLPDQRVADLTRCAGDQDAFFAHTFCSFDFFAGCSSSYLRTRTRPASRKGPDMQESYARMKSGRTKSAS
jgi:hypothetical protein